MKSRETPRDVHLDPEILRAIIKNTHRSLPSGPLSPLVAGFHRLPASHALSLDRKPRSSPRLCLLYLSARISILPVSHVVRKCIHNTSLNPRLEPDSHRPLPPSLSPPPSSPRAPASRLRRHCSPSTWLPTNPLPRSRHFPTGLTRPLTPRPRFRSSSDNPILNPTT